jgi:hypothetical protein
LREIWVVITTPSFLVIIAQVSSGW